MASLLPARRPLPPGGHERPGARSLYLRHHNHDTGRWHQTRKSTGRAPIGRGVGGRDRPHCLKGEANHASFNEIHKHRCNTSGHQYRRCGFGEVLHCRNGYGSRSDHAPGGGRHPRRANHPPGASFGTRHLERPDGDKEVWICPTRARVGLGLDPKTVGDQAVRAVVEENARTRQETVDKIRKAVEDGKTVAA